MNKNMRPQWPEVCSLSLRPVNALVATLVLAGLSSAQDHVFRSSDRWTSTTMTLSSEAELSIANLNRDGMPDAVVMDSQRLRIVLNPRAWLQALPLATPNPAFDSALVLPEGGHGADAILTAQGLSIDWWEMKQDILDVEEVFQTAPFLDGAALGWTEITDWRCHRFEAAGYGYNLLAIFDAPQQLIHRYMVYDIESSAEVPPLAHVPLGAVPAPPGTSHIEFYRFTGHPVPETIVASDSGMRVYGYASSVPVHQILGIGQTLALEFIPGTQRDQDLLAWLWRPNLPGSAQARVFLGSELTDELPVYRKATTIRSGDFNQDGITDLCVGPDAEGHLRIYQDTGEGHTEEAPIPVGVFGAGTVVEQYSPIQGPGSSPLPYDFPPDGLVVAELGHGGQPDLVVLSPGSQALEVQYGTPDTDTFVHPGIQVPDEESDSSGPLAFYLNFDEELQSEATHVRLTVYGWNYQWDGSPGTLDLQGLGEDVYQQMLEVHAEDFYHCEDGRVFLPLVTEFEYPEEATPPALYGIEISAYKFVGGRPQVQVVTTFAYTRDVPLWEEMDVLVPQSPRLHPDEEEDLPPPADPPGVASGLGGTLAGGMIGLSGFDDFTDEDYIRVLPPEPVQ